MDRITHPLPLDGTTIDEVVLILRNFYTQGDAASLSAETGKLATDAQLSQAQQRYVLSTLATILTQNANAASIVLADQAAIDKNFAVWQNSGFSQTEFYQKVSSTVVSEFDRNNPSLAGSIYTKIYMLDAQNRLLAKLG
jgi:hypothetical protein